MKLGSWIMAVALAQSVPPSTALGDQLIMKDGNRTRAGEIGEVMHVEGQFSAVRATSSSPACGGPIGWRAPAAP